MSASDPHGDRVSLRVGQCADEALLDQYQPFFQRLAREFSGYGQVLSREDLAQEAALACWEQCRLHGAARQGHSQGHKLGQAARYQIREQVKRLALAHQRAVSPGFRSREIRALREVREASRRGLSEALAAGEQAGLSRAGAQHVVAFICTLDSDLAACRELPAYPPPEETALLQDSHALIDQAVEHLPARERKIVRQRWLSTNRVTLRELAEGYGVSAQRIRAIEQRALARLRAALDGWVTP